jgi:hypothetical protein
MTFKRKLPLVSLILGEKNFLINAPFQIQFMISVMLIAIVSMSIIYIANDYFFQSYLQKGIELNLAPDHPYFLMIHEQKIFMAKVFLSVALAISIITSLWGLFYSHKIAGPLYRLEGYFKQAAIKNEKLNTKIHFRKEDFFQELPDSINKYIDSINHEDNDLAA